jgi:hypothetical protein
MPDETTPERFVGSAQVVKDIRSIFIDGPVQIANELIAHIGRDSICDFDAQIIGSLASDTGGTLAQTIRTHIRSTQGDATLLKAANRLYVNPKTIPLRNSEIGITRTGAQLSYPLPIAYERDLVGHRAMLGECYTRVGNVLTFTRPARIMITAKLNWGVWSGADRWDAATVDPSWRFSSGGNNRTVTSSLSYLLGGNLAGGASTGKLLPQTTLFYEEEVYPAQVRQLVSSTVLNVKTPGDVLGIIDTLTFEVERSPYVITYGARTDHVGLFKETATGVEDTTNYFEIIEL